MILVAVTATSILICISSFDWYIFGGFILSVAVFFAYITKNKKAFISIDFFKNKLYASVLIVAFIIYSLYASYALSSFSFLLTEVYKVNLDTISLMFIPACISAAIVGALSGKFSKYFSMCIFSYYNDNIKCICKYFINWTANNFIYNYNSYFFLFLCFYVCTTY